MAAVHIRLKRFFLSLVLISFAAGVPYAQSAQRRQVLVLHSYSQGYQWTDEIQRGIQEAFAAKPEIELTVEYLDANNHQGAEHERLLRDVLSFKYRDSPIRFDAIIASDDHALDFLLKYREGIFPAVPVVFC